MLIATRYIFGCDAIAAKNMNKFYEAYRREYLRNMRRSYKEELPLLRKLPQKIIIKHAASHCWRDCVKPTPQWVWTSFFGVED